MGWTGNFDAFHRVSRKSHPGELMNRSSYTTNWLRLLCLAAFAAAAPVLAAAQTATVTVAQAPIWISKPDIAAFEKIENDHLAAGQRAIDQVLAVKGARTIDNTLVLFDEIVRQYNSAGYLSGAMQQVHPDAKFRDAAVAMTSKVGDAASSLALNQGVYKALAAVDLSGADAATKYYVERQLLEFRLAGVDKDDETRGRLKKLFDKLTDLQSAYDRNISDDQRSITIDSAAELDGMPKDFIDAHKPGPDGKIKLTTNYPDGFPILTFAKSDAVRTYLPYERVKKGVLDTAAKLFQLTFQQEHGVPGWDPTVETWDAFDQGKMIGRLYLDMHPREGKFSHAEMIPVLDGIRGKQLPEAVLVCNFPVPTADDPGLMDYSDVVTFFHEFGHLMHWMLSAQQWAGISGISMESDFGEAPSEMLEEWMHSPQVLATFAKHYKTNEPIPAELVARMNKADAFGRASWVMRQNVFTATSFDLYNRKPGDVDPDTIVLGDERRYNLFTPTPGIHDYASFGHLAGYSSAYYTYLWDKVIAEDFVTKFDRKDLLAPGPAARYRHLVLEPGGSKSANDLVKDFLGRAQNMGALKAWMSEEFETAPVK